MYDGLPPAATVLRAPTTFEEFLGRMYHVTGYEKQSTRLVVTSRYPVANEYIMLSITVEKTMEIAFAIVTPLGNSLEVYIDPVVESPPHYCVGSSFSGLNRQSIYMIRVATLCLPRTVRRTAMGPKIAHPMSI